MSSFLAAASMPQTRSDEKLLALSARCNAANTSLKRFLGDHRDVLVGNGETIFLRDQTPELQEKWWALHVIVTQCEQELAALRKQLGIGDFIPTPSVVTVKDSYQKKSDIVFVKIIP
jgi:hypothetical protein